MGSPLKKMQRQPPRMSRLMRLDEVAKLMGMEGRWAWQRLLRQLRRIEARSGATIVTETGEGSRRRYFVTMATLREHHPDFFYRRDEALEHLGSYVDKLEEELVKINDRIEIVAEKCGERMNDQDAELSELQTSLRRVDREVRRIAEHVQRAGGRQGPVDGQAKAPV